MSEVLIERARRAYARRAYARRCTREGWQYEQPAAVDVSDRHVTLRNARGVLAVFERTARGLRWVQSA